MDTIKTARFHGFIFIYAATASAFFVLMAMDMVGLDRTVLKAICSSKFLYLPCDDISLLKYF